MVTNLRQQNIIRRRSPSEWYSGFQRYWDTDNMILIFFFFFKRDCWSSLTGSIQVTINILQTLAWSFSVILHLDKINWRTCKPWTKAVAKSVNGPETVRPVGSPWATMRKELLPVIISSMAPSFPSYTCLLSLTCRLLNSAINSCCCLFDLWEGDWGEKRKAEINRANTHWRSKKIQNGSEHFVTNKQPQSETQTAPSQHTAQQKKT